MKYLRPIKLSDPGCDFNQKQLAKILAVSDENMGWDEFSSIFQPYLPAGNYEECIYFVPHALQYIYHGLSSPREVEGPELIANLIFWFVDNMDRLKKDNIWNDIIDELNLIFFYATDQIFIPEGRYLANNVTIAEMLNALFGFDSTSYLGTNLLLKLTENINYPHAGWLINIYINSQKPLFYEDLAKFNLDKIISSKILKKSREMINDFLEKHPDRITASFWEEQIDAIEKMVEK